MFADNLKSLPSVAHLEALKLFDASGALIAVIENKQGQAGSLAVYNFLFETYGSISLDAAKKGLDLYAEHTADAENNPNKHPNIDRLFQIIQSGNSLKVEIVEMVAVA